MPQPGESRTTSGMGPLAPELMLWCHVLQQQISDSCSIEQAPARQQNRHAARAFLAKPSSSLHLLLNIIGADIEHWHDRVVPHLRQAWELADQSVGHVKRGSHAVPRMLRRLAEARETEREQRRRERLEEARRGWRQALERCGYSSDPETGRIF